MDILEFQCYEDSIDNIIGIFYTKEIIREYIKNKDHLENFNLRDYLREAFFVVGSKKSFRFVESFPTKETAFSHRN